MNQSVRAQLTQSGYVRSIGGGGRKLKLQQGFSTPSKLYKNCYNSDMKYHIKRYAFTLAEILITLGRNWYSCCNEYAITYPKSSSKKYCFKTKKVNSV
jgi:hypothetical protein